jgi:predicted house-cleaning noncanonical NTP pyrophosphatase (MazG superfamily)
MAEKLIRDKIPDNARANSGEEMPIRFASEEEMLHTFLPAKLQEELQEALEAKELAKEEAEWGDFFEVLDAYFVRRGISIVRVHAAQAAKRTQKGGFDNGIIWTQTPKGE